MEFGPIWRSLKRNKAGYILIATQIAVTMAIMINSVAIMQQRAEDMGRPSGMDEANIFTFSSTAFVPETDMQSLIEEDLDAAGFAAIWGSGAGLKAICYGLPVFHEFPQWIGAPGAKQGYAHMPANPFRGDRIAMLDRVSWAQCSVEELGTAEPLARLLSLRRN